jgi:hypothetical protein
MRQGIFQQGAKQMTRTLALAAAVAGMLSALACTADANEDTDGARDASAIMASVEVCKTVVSEETKKALYSKMLDIWRTPKLVSYVVDDEIKALNKLSDSDRAAMCSAIGDRVKALLPEGGKPQ